MNEGSDRLRGWIFSISLHAVMGLIFLLITLKLQPFDLDFTPVTFAALAQVEPGGGSSSRKWGGAQPLVDLPTRPMLEETSPLLQLPERNRQAVIAPETSGKPDLSSVESLRAGQRVALESLTPGQRERAPIKPLPVSDEVLYGQRDDVVGREIAGQEAFTIEWEGPVRIKSSGNLPEFPSGVKTGAKVRLAFTVATDGTVESIRPLTKGQAQLEKVAIEALRSWRFNTLDRGLEQKSQDGVITFVFELK